jgi:uncharacterized protein YfaS (alpha-2-macroglobulin family)
MARNWATVLTVRSYRKLLGVLALAFMAAGGCSSASDTSTSKGSGGGDRPQNSSISIDESTVTGTVDKGQLSIDIPVQALKSHVSGALNVALQTVDGKTTLESTRQSYDATQGTPGHVVATFDVPQTVAQQADWVRSNVRIDDGSADGLRVRISLLRVVSPYELALTGAQKLTQDKTVSYRIHARNPLTRAPIEGLGVVLALAKGGAAVQTFDATTDALGDAVFTLTVPETGPYDVFASTAYQGTTTKLSGGVEVADPSRKVLLTSDKPIYQPGQTVHLRALALAPPEDKPIASATVTFEVEDGKGNKVLKRDVTSDSWGIAATDFEIGRIVNMGTFKLRAIVEGTPTEKTVDVSRYALPKFNVKTSVDKSWYNPGEQLSGTLDAGYFFGKPVAGADVVVEGIKLDIGETVFQKVVGKTDASGKMGFSLNLPSSLVGLPLEQGNALLTVRTTVTDTAGQEVKKDTAVVVASSSLNVVVVPEATDIVPGIENHLSLFVTDPLGEPVAGASATVTTGTKPQTATTDPFGYADVSWVPAQSAGTSVTVDVTPPTGPVVHKQFDFLAQAGSEHVLVRTDKSVYGVGDTVKVEVIATAGESHAYVDWLNQGQTVDMRTLTLDASGVASFTMPVDTALLGTNRVEAYVVDSDGNVIRTGRTIFARTTSSLGVSLSTNKPQYAPGEPAQLTFSVVDETGKPTVAALGVQIVDQAVFALVDAQPGLLKTYFQLEDAYSQPQYEIQPPPGSLPDLLFDKTESSDPAEAAAAQKKTAASLAALGKNPIAGLALASWPEVVGKANQLLVPYWTTEAERITKLAKTRATVVKGALAAVGCTPEIYYCDNLQQSFFQAFHERMKDVLDAYDFWGNAYSDQTQEWDYSIRLKSTGPDEQADTSDDHEIAIQLSDLGVDAFYGEPGANGSGGGGGLGMGGATATGGEAGAGGAGATGDDSGPRVRKDFPETLYVNPALITGPDGKASVQVDMADSITEWRVSTLAHSAGGKLGGGVSGIKVFQDFFADVNFPATLTRGDEIEFPIAVYNYLTTTESVKLELQAGSWYTPLGQTTTTVDVGPGEVIGVRFPVRVDTVGLQTLTVKATGSKVADAVARQVLVVPDGKEYPVAVSGSLSAGSVSHGVSFPTNSVPGSQELYLQVFPAYLSQVVTGMDSMLQVPNGCFEQTTSTAWPNVLVTRYMTQTGQITPEIQMKAESLLNAGYQRLLTFEHTGGGFSWFGEQDPAPYLSVTAFGLMEFADMAKVMSVDPAMIARTQNWLLAHQESDGSWKGDQSEFFSFQTSTLRNTAFVLWALGENGYTGPEAQKALAYVKGQLGTNEDAYTLGIVANAFARVAPNDPATANLLQSLDAKKKTDGAKFYWDSEGTQTNFYASGDDAAVTATALVAHAMLLAGGNKATVDGALEYLVGSKDPNGNFGSTQATIWTLRTLLLAAEKGTEGAVGSFEVAVDGTPFTTLSLTADKGDVMTTVDMKSLASLASHQVKLTFVGTGKVSYNLVTRYNIPWAQVPPEPVGPLSVSLTYDKTTLGVNDMALATVKVVNNTASVQNMVILTLGIPPGFAVQTDDLDAYKTAGTLSSYDLTGKQITLYLTALAPSATETFQYHLLATMPVKASDGGATAYLYYEPEKKTSAPPVSIEVAGN